MRILLVSQHFWPEEFRINDVADDLQKRGHSVSVLTGQPNYPAGRIFPGFRSYAFGRSIAASGYEIVRVPVFPRKNGRSLFLALNYLSFILSGSILGPLLLRKREFEVVVVYALSPIFQSIPAILIAHIQARPLVLWIQDLWPDSLVGTGRVRSRMLLSAVARVTGWIYRRSTRIIVQSRAFVAPVHALAERDIPIDYLPNSAEPGLEETDNKVSPKQFTVLFAGNIGAAQSIPTIVDAACQLDRQDPSIKLVVAGTGSEEAWLRSEIRRLQLQNISLLGRIPSAEMGAIYERSTVLLATLRGSGGIDLTIPSKIQSYLAVGRPIIAAMDGEGARVVHESGAGIVVPAGDAGGLAQAIVSMRVMSNAKRQSMGDAGRAYYLKHFMPNVLGEKLEKILEGASAE